MSRLVCSTCGAGPFKGLVGLRAHERSHDVVECPICGREVGGSGLGSHMRTHRGAPANTRLADALHRLLPGAAQDLVDRLAGFVAEHEPVPHIWAVITDADGPWLCHRTEVGRVGSRAGAPIVAVPIALVYEHLQETQP